jgi:SAM-dependent methyltransferase
MLFGMETITCPFCNLPGNVAISDEGWTARRCPKCRLAFVSPRPTAAEVAAIYTEDGAHSSASTHINHFERSAGQLTNRRTVKLLQRYRKTGRLLEIGPGGGGLMREAIAAGYEVAAVELNHLQAEHIRSTLGVPVWQAISDVEGRFDIVYHCDVLSHLFDPVSVFKEIRAVLNDGALHIFETGEGDFDSKYERLFSTFQFPDHLFLFSQSSLAELLSLSGFKHVKTLRYSIVPQLKFEKLISRVKGRRGQGVDGSRTAGTGTSVSATNLSGRLTHSALAWVRHLARYGLGRMTPRSGRPQTIVVVTRKS